jgi:hypothetical protein
MDLSEAKLIANLIEEAMQADLSDHDIAATLNLLAFTINRFIGGTTGILLPVLREIKYCRSPRKFRFVVDGDSWNIFLVQNLLLQCNYKAIEGVKGGFTLLMDDDSWISSQVC